MNKLLLIIFLTLSSLVSAKVPECFDQKHYFEDYYVNGIGVGRFENEDSIILLQQSFLIEKIIPLYNPTNYQQDYKIIYKEAMEEEEYTLALRALYYDSSLFGKSLKNDVINEVFPQKKWDNYIMNKKRMAEVGIEYTEKEPPNVTKDQAIDLLSKISPNKMNNVFAHSQGNFVANQMCYFKESRKMEIVSIASPSEDLPCNTFQNYVLFKNDQVIGKLPLVKPGDKLPTEDKDEHTFSLSHFLASYLERDDLVLIMKDKYKKTKDYRYQNDMNFPLLTISTYVDGKTKKIEKAKNSILTHTFCNRDSVGEIQEITRAALHQGYNSPTECAKLGDKESLTDIEKMRIISFLKLGSNPIEIATSIMALKRVHPILFSHPDLVSLTETLRFETNGNSLIAETASPSAIHFIDKMGTKVEESCLNAKTANLPIYLDLKPLEKGSKVSISINDYKVNLDQYPQNGAVKQLIGSINVFLNTNGSYTYKNELTPMNINGREVASTNTTFNTNYCNTLKNLNNSLGCGEFLKHLRDNVLPFLQ